MPNLDGLGLASAVRADERWCVTPMIALSSHAEDEDVRAGREAGFDDYLAKSDQNSLSDNLARAIRLAVSARDTEQRRRAS